MFLGVDLGEIVKSEHPESDEASGGNKKKYYLVLKIESDFRDPSNR